MASHYVSSSNMFETIKLYGNYTTTSQVLETLQQNAEVILVDEHLGLSCEFHLVSSSTNVGYVKKEYVYPLSGTAESAPFICNTAYPNYTYLEPEWQMRTENEPYINDKTNEYSVCITSKSLVPTSINDGEIIKNGIKALFTYYNKPNDDETIEKYFNYYIFAKIKDTYVPFRPFMRTKNLVTIHAKYFDAIEENFESVNTTPLGRDLSEVDFVLKINLKQAEQLFDSLASILGLYHTDVVFSNSTLVFSTSTLFGNEDVVQNDFVSEINFSEKKELVQRFKTKLDFLLSANNVDPTPEQNMIDDVEIQFAINSECNKIYDVIVKINNNCTPLRKSIDWFLGEEPVLDETTVNFIKNIYNINKIDKCKVPWYEFAEQYIYPPVQVQAPTTQENIQDYEAFTRLFNEFISFKQQTETSPVKTLKQLAEEEIDKARYEANYLFLTAANPLIRLLFAGDNSFDPTNLDVVLAKLEKSIYDSPSINKDAYAIQKEGQFYEVKVEKGTDAKGVSKGSIKSDTPSILPRETFKIYEKSESILITEGEGDNAKPIPYTLYFSSKAAQQKADLNRKSNNPKKKFLDHLTAIWNFVKKIGICKFVDIIWGCLMALCRALGIPIDGVISLSVMRSFSYDQMINDIIPYLPAEQQQFLYQSLLTELTCINDAAFLNILKTYLSSSEYSQLNLETASYEDIVKEVANRMIITTVSG